MSSTSRHHLVIAGSVVLFHLGALWALQTGLLQRAVVVIVPVQLFSEFIAPPRPNVAPPSPSPPIRKPLTTPAVRKSAAIPPPPMPLAIVDPTLTPHAPVGVVPQPVALASMRTPVAATPGPPVPPPQVELPSSDADYLQNPTPAYPAHSRRLGEQGKVILRVLIGVDGTAQTAEIRQSSGFDRLDQSALATVQRWRYVPGKRAGVVEAMWFSIPVNFILE